MAYDLLVSKYLQTDKCPKHLGTIEYSEFELVQELSKRTGYNLFARLSDPYKNQTFGSEDLLLAQKQMNELLVPDLAAGERHLIYKLAAIIAFALAEEESPYGIAD